MSSPSLVPSIRDASRHLVRELGFMSKTLASTDHPASAVHALIEIDRGAKTASELCAVLNLEKSSVSRMLRKLIEAGEVAEEASDHDGRGKVLSLTAKGLDTLQAINAFAQEQVEKALAPLPHSSREKILDGLCTYAAALQVQRTGVPNKPQAIITISNIYRPGLVARAIEMHMQYYTATAGFGAHFEFKLAAGLGDLLSRMASGKNGMWAAMDGDRIVGTLFIDGEDLGENKAHLRAFIVDDGVRGHGIGRRLLEEALRFVDEAKFEETHLWTFKGLDAARHLYTRFGFVMTEEASGTSWGKEVVEQHFIRK